VSDMQEIILLLALFACGAVAGLSSKWAPLSGWAALAFSLALVPGGIVLSQMFC